MLGTWPVSETGPQKELTSAPLLKYVPGCPYLRDRAVCSLHCCVCLLSSPLLHAADCPSSLHDTLDKASGRINRRAPAALGCGFKNTAVVVIVRKALLSSTLNISGTVLRCMPERQQSTAAWYRCVQVVINNAGILYRNSVETVTPEEMLESYKVNTMGPLFVAQALLQRDLLCCPVDHSLPL